MSTTVHALVFKRKDDNYFFRAFPVTDLPRQVLNTIELDYSWEELEQFSMLIPELTAFTSMYQALDKRYASGYYNDHAHMYMNTLEHLWITFTCFIGTLPEYTLIDFYCLLNKIPVGSYRYKELDEDDF